MYGAREHNRVHPTASGVSREAYAHDVNILTALWWRGNWWRLSPPAVPSALFAG